MPFIELDSLNEKEVFPGYKGRAVHTGTNTYTYWRIAEGASVPEHAHLHQQVVNVLQGTFELTVDGKAELMQPGKIAVILPHVKHSGRAVTYCELLDVFYPEREDYKF